MYESSVAAGAGIHFHGLQGIAPHRFIEETIYFIAKNSDEHEHWLREKPTLQEVAWTLAKGITLDDAETPTQWVGQQLELPQLMLHESFRLSWMVAFSLQAAGAYPGGHYWVGQQISIVSIPDHVLMESVAGRKSMTTAPLTSEDICNPVVHFQQFEAAIIIDTSSIQPEHAGDKRHLK